MKVLFKDVNEFSSMSSISAYLFDYLFFGVEIVCRTILFISKTFSM